MLGMTKRGWRDEVTRALVECPVDTCAVVVTIGTTDALDEAVLRYVDVINERLHSLGEPVKRVRVQRVASVFDDRLIGMHAIGLVVGPGSWDRKGWLGVLARELIRRVRSRTQVGTYICVGRVRNALGWF